MSSYIASLFIALSSQFGIPEGILESMCYKESNHRVDMIHYNDGTTHSYGICQVKYETARFMGFRGTKKELMQPIHNITYAAKYLSYQHKRYGNWAKAIIAYNQGSTKKDKTQYYYDVINIWTTKTYLK